MFRRITVGQLSADSKLASVLRRLGAQINAVDCTVSTEVCRKYGVDSYPTLKWFGAADSNGEEYSGGRT